MTKEPELTDGELVARWLMDREAIRELPIEERDAAIAEALDIIDLEAAARVARIDQMTAEFRDLQKRAAELRLELEK